MTESLGSSLRVIVSRSGHSVENLLIIGAVTIMGERRTDVMWISVVLGERNKGMKGINVSVASSHSKVLSLGSKGTLTVRSCSARRTSEVMGSSKVSTLRRRILRVCFWKSVHSSFVGILLKDFQIKRFSPEIVNAIN